MFIWAARRKNRTLGLGAITGCSAARFGNVACKEDAAKRDLHVFETLWRTFATHGWSQKPGFASVVSFPRLAIEQTRGLRRVERGVLRNVSLRASRGAGDYILHT